MIEIEAKQELTLMLPLTTGNSSWRVKRGLMPNFIITCTASFAYQKYVQKEVVTVLITSANSVFSVHFCRNYTLEGISLICREQTTGINNVKLFSSILHHLRGVLLSVSGRKQYRESVPPVR